MPLPTGTVVAVCTLGNKRGVVVAVDRDARYQVRLGAVTMWCDEAELIVAAEPRKKKAAGRKPPLAPANDDASPGRIDLHGLTVDEALARVDVEIDRSLLRGADRVEVMHGKGSGRIRNALHRQFASMPVVATFRLDPRNAGITWVRFR